MKPSHLSAPFRLLSAALIVTLAAACDNPVEPGSAPHKLPLVVEGWIDDGDHPYVIVTRAIDLSSELDSLDRYVEKWCRVTVDDGSENVILTGRVRNDYVPSFLFTTGRMTGEVGRTYTLRIEIESAGGTEIVEATTTIPAPVRIDSLRVSPTAANDTLYQLFAFPRINTAPGNYYKFFAKVNSDETRYYSSFLGTFEGNRYDRSTGFSVSRGIHQTYAGTDKFTPYYQLGDTVSVKLCVTDRQGFDFWNAYENSVSLSGNLFFSFSAGCPTNLSGNAKGYWLGYGVSMARTVIR